MVDSRLRFEHKISARLTKEMILCLAQHGNHNDSVSVLGHADVERLYTINRISYGQVVEHCRDPHESVPIFENLLGSTANAIGGATISRVDNETGQEDLRLTGPGQLVLSQYWATFEAAKDARDRSIQNASYMEFLTAITLGLAAIEGYLNYRAERWNRRNPAAQLLDDVNHKVSLENKIDQWIPAMTAGRRVFKNDLECRDFKLLQKMRNDGIIHPKQSGFAVGQPELASYLNSFRTGIAGMLIKLHIPFKEPIPAIIIRASFAPDVIVDSSPAVTAGTSNGQRSANTPPESRGRS